ncbi:MAG: prepilin-type N-terminal cleavage/methylation domain-containing protein [Sedimentisphaerales bacterium]|nr:prepilin-type N-terminal cleavage/methylation domain-containing protein [Sedimentisphaerales bacterium]
MDRRKHIRQKGLTLTELMIAIVVGMIVIIAVAVMLVDGQRGWNSMYERVWGDVETGGHIARKTFDSVIRKASRESFLLGDSGDWIEIYYYSTDDAAVVDRYASFYCSDGDLNLEYGNLNPRETLSVQTVCGNVSDCVFKRAGRSAQMILTLDDDSRTSTTTVSAVLHNE